MRVIIDCIYLLAALAFTPTVVYRMVRFGRYRSGWANRFGNIGRKDPALKKCIWLHAVSLGEVNAAKSLVTELEKRFPSFEIVITATTDTGYNRALAVFGEKHKVFYFPLDFSFTMNHAFLGIQPALCILMELEVWPNFVLIADELHTPVIVVNGRMTDKSFSRYTKIKPLARKIFQKLALVLAQTDEYAQRFIEIGCQKANIFVIGSLKYDTAQIADKVEGADTLAEQLKLTTQNPELETQLWVAGATGPGEEQIILDVYKDLKGQFSGLRLAIVPRKPERFDEIAELIRQNGFDLIRYSEIKNNERQVTPVRRSLGEDGSDESRVILGDTMGDLRKFYSLATIIFAGRSLVPMGGSDIIEAAALGKCTIFGPSVFNFQQTADDLLAAQGAIMVKDGQNLFETMQKCLSEPDFTEKIARNGQNVIRNNQGATQKTIDQIERLLDNTKKKQPAKCIVL
ncbi:MAG: 3-deoxy-D-manno-octulosonic acid transferase [Sedimentisphaerales bacterium]|nr:3-deoxy-D-manno-octulosonic acid transferase [Sedimentisphaerales bacterium]